MGCIPVVFIQNPLGWEYEVLSMVTGQSTTGTGVFSEFAASMTDLFGMQSGRYNAKLKAGEEMCFAQLRKQTIQLGGNAVIATDIDYSEVGGDKGMLMVCMAGTAVKVKNPVRLGQEKLDDLDEISRLWERLKVLDNLNKSAR
nr:hypothetical protein A6C57_25640 [Fibrella sp. ES10-3-2-2]